MDDITIDNEFQELEMCDAESIVSTGNQLARLFYRSMGYVAPEGFRFDKATHPQEKGCWNLAAIAFDFLEGTDLQECLLEMEDSDE